MHFFPSISIFSDPKSSFQSTLSPTFTGIGSKYPSREYLPGPTSSTTPVFSFFSDSVVASTSPPAVVSAASSMETTTRSCIAFGADDGAVAMRTAPVTLAGRRTHRDAVLFLLRNGTTVVAANAIVVARPARGSISSTKESRPRFRRYHKLDRYCKPLRMTSAFVPRRQSMIRPGGSARWLLE